MDYQPIGSKLIRKDDAVSLSIFSQEGANYIYLDSIKTKDAIKTTIAINGKGSQSWRIGRDHGLVMSGSETLIATEDIVICYGVNPNIPRSLISGIAYYSAKATPNLTLTTTLVTVDGYVPFSTPKGISELNGVITVESSGFYDIGIERSYENGDINPSSPIELTIEVWKNGVFAFGRTGKIGAATANDEPAIRDITSPSIIEMQAGDEYELKFSASENGSNPSDTVLKIVQIKILRVS